MEVGKIPNDILKNLILDKIRYTRSDVLIKPKIGEDCSAIDFGENVCVLSTDPITGAVNEVGRLAVHVSCNDIASSGVEPIGLMITLLAPAGTTEADLGFIMGQVCDTAASLNVDILGGHTEITTAVNRFVIISTAVGKALKERLVTTSGAKPGDSIIMTKSAGIEGTAIIAFDKEKELADKLGRELVNKAKEFVNQISVVKEGVIAGEFGVNSMHDVTEGGILGAVWEVAEASGVGIEIYKEKIPVEPETLEISRFYGIDPYRLISSGCMIICSDRGNELVRMLCQHNVKATIIGKITAENRKILVCEDNIEDIHQPLSDELFKVIK